MSFQAWIIAVGNLAAATRCVEAPAMEGAAQGVAIHPAAMAQVRTQVGAVGVHDRGLAAVVAPQDELSPHGSQWPNVPSLKIFAIACLEPAKAERCIAESAHKPSPCPGFGHMEWNCVQLHRDKGDGQRTAGGTSIATKNEL